ncbi:MAG TPA: hypothetical protein VIK65_09175 [Candidatus Limnocylindrales bacterium]|jgi:hypothetical protein
MTHPMHHIRRRGRAIDRLRFLTTGAAVVGIAGTAGFGALAAATWSGTPGATSAADGAGNSGAASGTGGTTASGPGPTVSGGRSTDEDDDGATGGDLFGTVPNGAATLPGTTRVRPAQPGSGRSHATSGGSH